jgi:hypothetical protein
MHKLEKMNPHGIRQAMNFFDLLYRQQKEAIRDRIGHILIEKSKGERDWNHVSSKLTFEREYINMGDLHELAPMMRFIKRTLSREII